MFQPLNDENKNVNQMLVFTTGFTTNRSCLSRSQLGLVETRLAWPGDNVLAARNGKVDDERAPRVYNEPFR